MNEVSTEQTLVAEQELTRPFIVAGERAYVIGCQDGSFPDMGWHVKGEMGGVWAHPIKLLDGYWVRVGDTWLSAARRFRVGPYWAEHEYELGGLRLVRRELVLDDQPAVVVRYTFDPSFSQTVSIRFLARTDLRDVWSPFPDTSEPGRDQASFDRASGAWRCWNDAHPWHVVLGARGLQPIGHDSGQVLWGPDITSGHGISVALEYQLELKRGQTVELEFVIAGSDQDAFSAQSSHRHASENLPRYVQARAERSREMLTRSALDIPDPSITRAWDWVKCDYDWLVRAAEPWGRGLGAGVADYPWWFGCDNGYALRGCLALGQHDIAIDTLDLLRRLSAAANDDSGRVIHEANTRGVTTDRGRTEETPHFVRAVWDTFLWTGDVTFLERNYPFCKRGLLEWTLREQNPDGDLLPYGYGVMEMAGLNLQCVDTASLTVEALAGLAGMADVLGEPEVAARCRELHDAAASRLEEAFWMEAEGLYGDMVATPAEMAPRLRQWVEQAATRNPAAAERLRRLLAEAESSPDQDGKRPWMLQNWSVLGPIEAGLAEPRRAVRALERVEGPEFTGKWGLYICGTYRDMMMTIGTGVMAVAEAAYGRAEQALSYVRMLTDTLDMQMPGGISEMSPDYGCFVQAWSGYGVAWPVVAGVFGVKPDAFHRRVKLEPIFPAGWSHARLDGVRVGTNSLDLRWDGVTLWVTSHEPGWEITSDSVPVRPEQSSPPLAPGESTEQPPGTSR